MASIGFSGDTSGLISVTAPLVAGSGTLTLPTGTDTLVGKATTDTLTNKSIAATQLTGTIAAARLPAGSVLQVKNLQTGAVATGTTVIPFDDTIPQITEGTQFMSLAITPISATSKLLICVVATASSSLALQWMTSALFQDSTANALAANSAFTTTGTAFSPCVFNHFMTSGTTSSTTFTVRSGSPDAGTTTFNGQSADNRLGGVLASSITITEIAA
jgi:hypothetical protein